MKRRCFVSPTRTKKALFVARSLLSVFGLWLTVGAANAAQLGLISRLLVGHARAPQLVRLEIERLLPDKQAGFTRAREILRPFEDSPQLPQLDQRMVSMQTKPIRSTRRPILHASCQVRR